MSNHFQEEITFQNNNITLQGTLTRPATAVPHPLIIIAHTSDAPTRDFGVYQHLTQILPPIGLAVFLFDRRGSGKSSGSFENASLPDLATDILAALHNLKRRPDINPAQIGLWGMSQGGWIAPLAASKSAEITFLIAVSAVGTTPAEQMNYSAQWALQNAGYPQPTVEKMLELRALTDDYYRGHARRANVQPRLDQYRPEPWYPLAYLDDLLPHDPAPTKWRQIMDYDPRPTIQKLQIPVLLLFAEQDPWVPIPQSIAVWQKYAPPNTTIHQVKDANHFMIAISQAGLHSDHGPMAAEYTAVLTTWLTNHLALPSPPTLNK